jgi:hypothetical protein
VDSEEYQLYLQYPGYFAPTPADQVAQRAPLRALDPLQFPEQRRSAMIRV